VVPFDRRAVSKALSRIAAASVADVLAAANGNVAGRARVVGITGAPGAGKSTLIGRLAAYRLRHADSLAIIAIDPTSPRSQGSLLGDRIRMDALSADPRVFIRSLPSRTAEDGLTENLAEIVATLDAFGFDEVLIETVGVGQTAYGVWTFADAEVLVLTPGTGDYVQAMKAGIMETADIYVINKADQPGADRVAAELLGVLRRGRDGEELPVIPVRAGEETGIEALSAAVDRHLAQSSDPYKSAAALRARRRYRVQQLIRRKLRESVDALPASLWDEPIHDNYRRVLGLLCADLHDPGRRPGRNPEPAQGSDDAPPGAPASDA
jgi:LAO/AO transport system kinase